jgi:hypothetical protein
MSPVVKREYLEAIRLRYRRAKKGKKTKILDEFCEVCGYDRKYAIRLLNRRKRRRRNRPGPKRQYGPEVAKVLKRIWLASEQMCSKRLKAALPMWLPYYEKEYGELPKEVWKKVLRISPPTIDRLLSPVRAKQKAKGLCGTKPGTLLRNQIPIRTEHWDITGPGYLEADTVAHCGNSMAGSFVWSLTFTDLFSGWTENRATWNKGAEGVLTRVKELETCLAFPLLGFDCDNGSEFLNYHLLRYFQDRPHHVDFTRSRPYRKNDNAHVEQKHWTHVRQLFGYDRFDQPQLVDLMNDLYSQEWSLLQNFFCPSFKLKSKQRVNSKYIRHYDEPQTPYQRLIKSPKVSKKAKKQLRDTFESLNPFQLKRGIEQKLKKIFNLLHTAPSWVNAPLPDDRTLW